MMIQGRDAELLSLFFDSTPELVEPSLNWDEFECSWVFGFNGVAVALDVFLDKRNVPNKKATPSRVILDALLLYYMMDMFKHDDTHR